MSLPRLLPGLLLSVAVAALALAAQAIETRLLGRPWIEALVLAILIGAAARAVWTPGPRSAPGVAFSAKTLLEVAVALLGAGISVGALLEIGPALFVGIAGLVAAAVLASYALGRLLKLSPRLALLIACGNSICGNSAIAAVAPVIRAEPEEVSASLAFTAVLGVLVVLALPVLGATLGLSARPFGVFAGLTVYAVPQVLAATAATGAAATQVGALVKLVRVLMLGPVVMTLGWMARRRGARGGRSVADIGLGRLAPWFIVVFLGLMALRSADLLPPALLRPAAEASQLLAVVAMGALGLEVDLTAVAKAGPRVVAAVSLSLIALGLLALGLMRALGLA